MLERKSEAVGPLRTRELLAKVSALPYQFKAMTIAKRKHWVHLKLPSNERVLVSVAKPGIKVMQLGFFGLVPIRTIWHWPKNATRAQDQAMFDLMTRAPKADTVAAQIAAIIMRDCKSIDDIRRALPPNS